MAPQSPHRRAAARLGALIGAAALISSVAVVSATPLARNVNAHLRAGDTARVTCEATLSTVLQTAQEVRLACGGAVPPTPTRVPTSTPVPTAIPVPTATATPAGATLEGVPVCAHDPRRWHGTVERNADNTIRCAYGHTHMDDPRPLDGVFGALPYGEISYPWETLDENHNKHNVYKWVTYSNPTCQSRVPGVTIKHARMQYHGDGHGGALTRFHSFFVQAEWCDTTDPSYAGRLQTGGWIDYGILFAGETHVALPNDPPRDSPAFGVDKRLHGSPTAFRGDFTWYGAQRPPSAPLGKVGVELGLRNEDWGPIDPARPNNPLLFYGGAQNGSWQGPLHVLSVYVEPFLTDYTGYTDRHGAVVQGCTAVGLDCVPFQTVGMRAGASQFRGEDGQAQLPAREYDVASPVTGNSLLKYPN
jgi:hypothetical protein